MIFSTRLVKKIPYEEALKLKKEGKKVSRYNWNGKGMFVVMQKGYPDGIPCNKQTAEAWGMNEGDLFKCEPYFQIKTASGSHAMWVPSVGDILATDWFEVTEEMMAFDIPVQKGMRKVMEYIVDKHPIQPLGNNATYLSLVSVKSVDEINSKINEFYRSMTGFTIINPKGITGYPDDYQMQNIEVYVNTEDGVKKVTTKDVFETNFFGETFLLSYKDKTYHKIKRELIIEIPKGEIEYKGEVYPDEQNGAYSDLEEVIDNTASLDEHIEEFFETKDEYQKFMDSLDSDVVK